jgi:hypothetical protein
MRDVSPRLAGVVGASCLLAGWLLGSAVRPPVAHMQAAPRPAPEPPLPRLDIPSVAGHRQRLSAAMDAPTPVRNPFAFGADARATRRPPLVEVADAAPATVEIPVPPPPPAWTLVGVALDAVDGDERITAILSNGGDVHLATAGVGLPGGYTVVRVAPDHAVLQDGAGAELVVRLR